MSLSSGWGVETRQATSAPVRAHLLEDVDQHGDDKGGRLARPSLSDADHVALLHAQGDRSHLDG